MLYCGFDIGGTKCAVSIGTYEKGEELNILSRIQFKTKDIPSPYAVIDEMIRLMGEACEQAKVEVKDVAAIGVSCGGPLDSKRGVILSPPNLIGWDNIEIVDYVQKKTGIKCALQNDANACALAEWLFGAGKGTRNMIFFTFGTGLGAGLILDGKLYSGTNDNAGEAGHMRLGDYGPVGYGKNGSFEGFCSGNGIAQIGRTYAMELLQQGKTCAYAKSMADLDSVTAKTVGDAAEAGDETAIRVYAESGRRLGQGLSVIVDLFNPELIVIGGVFMRSRDLLYPYADQVMRNECLPLAYNVCKVVPAKLSENIGDYAALAIAASSM